MRKLKLFLLTFVALLGGVTPSWADTWTVAGSSSDVLGPAWDPTETSNDMTQVDGTTLWYLTKQSVALTAGDIYFKVCKDYSWGTAYPENDRTLTVDAAGTYDVTFWYNSADNAVYATYVYSIMGNLWDNWATDKDMVQDSENPFVYTLTIDEFAAEANKTYEYKLHANHAWADYQIPSGSGNNSWIPTEAGKYTLVFTANVTTHTLELTATKIEEPAAGYTVDFNTAIATSSSDFKVASNWKHIVDVDTYYDNNMYYSYKADQGIDGSGALLAMRQQMYDYGSTGTATYDLLVTPVVSGTVTIFAKPYSASSSTKAFVEFYSVNEDGTARVAKLDGGQEWTSTTDATFEAVTIEVTEAQRIGIRAQYVYLDNFSATNADIVPEKSLTVTKVMNSDGQTGTTGTNPAFEQQPDGNILVNLKVELSNTGDVDFVAGTTENYTMTLGYSSLSSGTPTFFEDAAIAISEDLAVGETKSFDVEFTVPYVSGYKYWFIRENVTGTTTLNPRYCNEPVAYEPKFIFRVAESTSTSSLSGAQAYGLIGEETTKNYEIANTGTAPLVIKSITLPEGFTSANMPEIPTEGLTIAKGETQALDITLPITTMGSFSGNLTIVYLDKNSVEKTYTLAFSGNVLAAGTWAADFSVASSSETNYPAGSVAENGIRFGTTYVSTDNYDGYLYSYTSSSYASENNKFITPKLHAAAGDKLTFDVRRDDSSSSTYNLKVYVSTDRKTWGEPVYSVTAADLTSSFQTQEISFDAEGDYYVAFAIYGVRVDNLVGLTKVDVAHDLFIKSVNWPDASVKSSTSLSMPSLDVIPLTDEAADAYTVKYVCGETVLAEGTPVALTASANSSKTFSFSWTPSVETTTTYPATKIVFEFTDGTKIETAETFDLTVTNEPKFHFLSSLPSSKWNEPTDVSTPIAFGKTNTADSRTYYVYNWGSAPLTVTSVKAPDGFTATPAGEFTVAAFDESDMSVAAQAVEITFSATEAGEYSGDLMITYLDGANAEQTFTLAVSGTKLDPTKFYANFDDGGWPAGSVYQSSISSSNQGTSSVPNYAITSSSTTNNIFVTPKLTAAAGDKLMFDAKLYNSYSSWASGAVKVYAAATRDEVLNAEEGTTRQQLFSVSGQDEEGAMTTDYQTFEVPALAGDYYYGFEISNRPYVDEIYGLTQTAVAHDWALVSSNIPAGGMQNNAVTATVNVANFGVKDEAAEDIQVIAYLNGEAVATAEGVAIPMSHQLSAAGTQLSVSYLVNKVGTFPVYLEVKAGDYSVATEPVDVVFAEEEVKSDVATGESAGTDGSIPLNMYYKNSETIALYTQSALGLNGGEKIKSITYKGYSTKTFTSSFKVYYEWTDDTSISAPTSSSAYDVTGMTEAINEESYSWQQVGSSTELGDMIVINFGTPVTYEAGKSLRILVSSSASSDAGYNSFNFEKSTTTGLAYQHQNDGTKGVFTGSWSAKNLPMIHLALDATAATLAGNVKTSAGAGIEGATVTLKADNGVEYSGTTAADGSYSFNVIQAGLDFIATVEAEGYLKRQFALNMNGTSATSDVTLYTQIGIVGDAGMGLDWNNDKVMTQSDEDPNIFTLVVDEVAIAAGTYEYKLRADGAWNLVNKYQLPDEGNQNWVFGTDMYPAGKYKLTFTADMTNHTLELAPELLVPTGISNLDTTNTLDGDIYNVGGVRSDKLQRGQLNIVRTKDGKVRKVVIK